MALNKIYNRINWQNRPSTATALGATNLNKMDYSINEVDNRVVLLDDSKADKETVNKMVKNVTMNPTTGVLTVTLLDGTKTSYDLDIEKVVTNFNLNEKNQLVLTLAEGAEKVIDLSKFIDTYTFTDTETIDFTNTNKTISAIIKKGSLKEEYFNTTLFNEIRQKALDAQDAAADSLQYSKDSKRFAVGGEIEGDTEDNAKYYKEQAEQFKNAAQAAADKAESVTKVSIATEEKAGVVKASKNFKVLEDGSVTIIPPTHTHNKSQITDMPTSLPANGGNAETVNGHTVNSNVPAGAKFTDTVYSHPTSTGNKHIPRGGASGQILKWSADGTATWGTDNNTVYVHPNDANTRHVTDAEKTKIKRMEIFDTKDNTVSFQEASARDNIATGEKHSILMGKIKRWFSDLRGLAFKDKVATADLEATLKAYIDSKFASANIIQNTEIADTSKVVSAAVTHNLQQQITQLNQNLTIEFMNIPIHSDCIALPEIGLCRIYKIGRLCIGTANVRAKNIASDQICVCLELPNSYKPIQTVQGLTVENVGFPEKSRVFAVYPNGGIFIFRTQNLASNYVLCFQYFTA